MSDNEYVYDSDQEVSKNHSKLIDAVRQLDKGQRIQKPQRSEPSLEVSEFHLVKSGITDKNAVEIEDLAKTLGKKGYHAELSKKINSTNLKSKVLPKPLERPAAERIKRSVGFKNTAKELGKWSGIIARNRTAACVSFPLSQSSMKLQPTEEYIKQFRLQSELEKKLAELEPQKDPEEEEDKFPLTLQEILERRKESAKFRAQESYKVAKAHRLRKIKSKKYHRIQRKEKIKKTLKEFEELQKTDPQAALEKLEQLDKSRAQERMTLRHKSTGQWAKNKQVRAKYDKESRQALAEQLKISRELTEKSKKDDDSEEDDVQDQPIHLLNSDKDNPWMNAVKTESEIDEFIRGYKKYWEERNNLEKSLNDVGKKNSNMNVIANESNNKFEENQIKNLLKNKNPVQEVIEEHSPHQNGLNEFRESESENETEENTITNKHQKKKLQKLSKDKLGIKSPKSKLSKVKSKVKVGTSNWSISPIDSPSIEFTATNTKDIDIDDLFESVEDKVQEKINTKLKKVKRLLDKETKYEQKKNRKKLKVKPNDFEDDVEKLGLKGQQNVNPILSKPIEESTKLKPSNEEVETKSSLCSNDFNSQKKSKTNTTEIDPNKFINMKPKHINTLLPDEAIQEGALDDDEVEEDQEQMISEAFADDDVVDEFRKEKAEEIKNSEPGNIDLRLPGWGSWGGKNLKASKRKKRRFLIKIPKQPPRRDENKGNVVIIEEKTSKIKRHLVSDIPFPFNSVQDFEASMRAPIGRDFVPEKTFSKLVQPAVKTKMGKVIEPMSEDVLVKTTCSLKKRKRTAVKKDSTKKNVKSDVKVGSQSKKRKQ